MAGMTVRFRIVTGPICPGVKSWLVLNEIVAASGARSAADVLIARARQSISRDFV